MRTSHSNWYRPIFPWYASICFHQCHIREWLGEDRHGDEEDEDPYRQTNRSVSENQEYSWTISADGYAFSLFLSLCLLPLPFPLPLPVPLLLTSRLLPSAIGAFSFSKGSHRLFVAIHVIQRKQGNLPPCGDSIPVSRTRYLFMSNLVFLARRIRAVCKGHR